MAIEYLGEAGKYLPETLQLASTPHPKDGIKTP